MKRESEGHGLQRGSNMLPSRSPALCYRNYGPSSQVPGTINVSWAFLTTIHLCLSPEWHSSNIQLPTPKYTCFYNFYSGRKKITGKQSWSLMNTQLYSKLKEFQTKWQSSCRQDARSCFYFIFLSNCLKKNMAATCLTNNLLRVLNCILKK